MRMTSFAPKLAVGSSLGGNISVSWPAARTGATTVTDEAATMRIARSAVVARRDPVEILRLMVFPPGEPKAGVGRTGVTGSPPGQGAPRGRRAEREGPPARSSGRRSPQKGP